MGNIRELKSIYSKTKNDIKLRLNQFDAVWQRQNDEEIFYELAFCLLTPQSKAKVCWDSVLRLKERGVHENCQADGVCADISRVRFKNRKSEYIEKMHKDYFRHGKFALLDLLAEKESVNEKRDYLVSEIKGIGYKEASHFLRNIGFGGEIAILDRHILKNLIANGIIKEMPTGLGRKRYLNIEEKMLKFSKKIEIPMAHLDFVMWYKEAGEIFK